jgi:hypothetical protein
VDAATANGVWTFKVIASDTIDGSGVQVANQTAQKLFYVNVNKNEITGFVELESFKGTNANVVFKAGDGAAVNATWTLPLTFTSRALLSAGSFPTLGNLVAELNSPSTAVTRYLVQGQINNLAGLVNALVNSTDGVSAYLRTLFYGYVTTEADVNQPKRNIRLHAIATKLQTPGRAVDILIKSKLSASTLNALASYMVNEGTNATFAAQLTSGLLVDFNNIALGPYLYDALTFQGVPLDQAANSTQAKVNALNAIIAAYNANNSNPVPPGAGSTTVVTVNRLLLQDIYANWNVNVLLSDNYVAGVFSAQTMYELLAYPNGNSANLELLLLNDFYTLTTSYNIWDTQRFLGIVLSGPTSTAVLANAAGAAGTAGVVNMNRLLLQDAYKNLFTVAKFAPETMDLVKAYPAALTTYINSYNAKQATYAGAEATYDAAWNTFVTALNTYKAALATYTTAYNTYKTGYAVYYAAVRAYQDATVAHDAGTMSNGDYATATTTFNTASDVYNHAGTGVFDVYTAAKNTFNAAQIAYNGAATTMNTAKGDLVTAIGARDADKAALNNTEAALVTEFNKIINGGATVLWNATRFAAFSPIFGTELNTLISNQSDSVRMNRLLLEAAYPGMISQSVLAPFTLIAVPEGTMQISAKTSFSLRQKVYLDIPVGGYAGMVPDAVVKFINNGLVKPSDTSLPYYANTINSIPAGDISGDNKVNLTDYSLLKANFSKSTTSTSGITGDLNGDNKVNLSDYNLLRVNYNRTGDSEVNVP